MLVLKRRRSETVQIGPDITITIVGIEAGAVVLGISAPVETQITRIIRVIVEGDGSSSKQVDSDE
jgi:carbon storage regulator CsrA